MRTDEPERQLCDRHDPPGGSPGGLGHYLAALTVTGARWHRTILLVTFDQIGDRNAAEAARGLPLHATIPADAPQDPDEFYDHQLVGLAAPSRSYAASPTSWWS